MYDSLLEAYGLTRWLSDKKKIDRQNSPLSGGKKTPQIPPLG